MSKMKQVEKQANKVDAYVMTRFEKLLRPRDFRLLRMPYGVFVTGEHEYIVNRLERPLYRRCPGQPAEKITREMSVETHIRFPNNLHFNYKFENYNDGISEPIFLVDNILSDHYFYNDNWKGTYGHRSEKKFCQEHLNPILQKFIAGENVSGYYLDELECTHAPCPFKSLKVPIWDDGLSIDKMT